MRVWKLEVEVDGEREGCYFSSSEDADCAFQMLLADYGLRLSSARLTSPDGRLLKARAVKQPDTMRDLCVESIK